MWLLEKFYLHVVALYFYWTVLFEQRFLCFESTNSLLVRYWLHYAANFAHILLGSQINTGTAVNLSVSHRLLIPWGKRVREAVSTSTSQTWGTSAFPSHLVLQSPWALDTAVIWPSFFQGHAFWCVDRGKRGWQLGFIFHFAVFSFLELRWSSQLLLSSYLVCL